VVPPYFQVRHRTGSVPFVGLLLLAAILLLPTLFPEKTAWLTTFVPLPFFYYHVRSGEREGLFLIRNAILLAAGGALLFGTLPLLLFPLSLVPVAIALSYGVFHKKSPVTVGLTGTLVLAATWILYWSGYGLLHQANPYTELLLELDAGLRNGLVMYEKSAGLAPETLENVHKAVELLRIYIPKVLPALLISSILGTVWLNQMLGNWLLEKNAPEITTWPEFNKWQIPEPFVWLVILSGVMFLLLPQPASIIGLNGLIICCTVYFFQGLAIAACLLNRWSVPRLLRALIYALIFIQTYGIIILAFLGLLDVWADFRKLNQPTVDSSNSSA